MATAQELALLREAKMWYDHGAFGVLQQAEFFKAMEAEVGEPLEQVTPEPPVKLMPLVAPAPREGEHGEAGDIFSSTATVGGPS